MLKQFDFNLRTTKNVASFYVRQQTMHREGGGRGRHQRFYTKKHIKKGSLVEGGKRKGYKIVYTTRIIIIKMSQHKFSMFIVRLVIYCLMKQIKNFVAFFNLIFFFVLMIFLLLSSSCCHTLDIYFSFAKGVYHKNKIK